MQTPEQNIIQREGLEGLTSEQMHDMVQIRGGMALGVMAAQGVLGHGEAADCLQDLLHQICNEWRELEQTEKDFRLKGQRGRR